MKKMERSSSSSEVVDGGGPKMGLRVLFVEADDCTRRLVAALLRKCSYKVLAVSDGLKAWETLKNGQHNIDLILTEMELPSISGYALLTLIMEHDICRSIPVIMMSSQDSISVVLKCMLRGAADFLVKPIRRNELRNLWQHVWRRQNKTEVEIIQNTTDAKCKVVASCQKNSDGNELSSSNMSSGNRKEESLKLTEKSVLPKSETGGKPSRSGPEVVPHEETYKSTVSTFGINPASARSLTSNAGECTQSNRENDNTIGETNSCSHEYVEQSSAVDYISKFEDYPETDNGCFSAKSGIDKPSFAPYLELSSRKSYPTGAKDEGTTEQHTLNHSNVSAFSRYENITTLQSSSSAVDCNVGPVDVMSSSHENLMTRTVSKFGQVETAIQGSQFELIPLADLSSSTMWHDYLPRTFNTQDFASLFGPNSNGRCDQSILPLSSSFHSGLENQNDDTIDSHHNVLEDDKEGGLLDGLRDVSVPDLCANSSSCGGATEKLNGGVCSSNCSTVDDSSSHPPASVRKSLVSESVYSSQLNVQEGVLGMDSCNLSQREAALQKFRLKRKDRCFDKKVRYQSRKRLAEQRPRVKGQFVRQVHAEPSRANC